MWMLGCCIYVLVFGKHPYEHKEKAKILNEEVVYPEDNFFTGIMKKLLVKNPKMRLTAREVVELLNGRLETTE